MKRILVITDDLWHPAEIIEKGFSLLNEPSYRFEFIKDAKDILTPQNIYNYDVIINCKSDCITAANTAPWFEEGVSELLPNDFKQYVQNGGGFIAIHSANAFSEKLVPDMKAYQKPMGDYIDFVGNRFIDHPPRCDIKVHITDMEHPVTRGVEDFTIHDEHYQIEVVANDAHLLFNTVSQSGGTQTGGYVREIGKGRLCVLTPGHILSVWENKSYRQLILNAIKFCSSEN